MYSLWRAMTSFAARARLMTVEDVDVDDKELPDRPQGK